MVHVDRHGSDLNYEHQQYIKFNASFSQQTHVVAILCYCCKHELLMCDAKCGEKRCRNAKETVSYENSDFRVMHIVYNCRISNALLILKC